VPDPTEPAPGAGFHFDQTRNGGMLKLLNVIDEQTRECLVVRVGRSIDADDIVPTPDKIVGEQGFPVYVRFDNGSEFVTHAVWDWCRLRGAGTPFIDRRKPWHEAWVESFEGSLRDELLNGQIFDSLLEAHVLVEDRHIDHDENRPHGARQPPPRRVRRGLEDRNQLQIA